MYVCTIFNLRLAYRQERSLREVLWGRGRNLGGGKEDSSGGGGHLEESKGLGLDGCVHYATGHS